jgi:hypothetical protein
MFFCLGRRKWQWRGGTEINFGREGEDSSAFQVGVASFYVYILYSYYR